MFFVESCLGFRIRRRQIPRQTLIEDQQPEPVDITLPLAMGEQETGREWPLSCPPEAGASSRPFLESWFGIMPRPGNNHVPSCRPIQNNVARVMRGRTKTKNTEQRAERTANQDMGLRTTGRPWPILYTVLTADGAHLRQAMQCCSRNAPVRRRAHPSLHSYGQKFSHIKGRRFLSIKETARPSLCARMESALALPCLCTSCSRSFLPGSLPYKKSCAAR